MPDEKYKRINMVVSPEIKEKWDKFIEKNEIRTISKLIRNGVENYIRSSELHKDMEGYANYSHELKEELNSIKGFSQILIEEYKNELSWDVLLKIKEIYDKSINIEKIIKKILFKERVEKDDYDVLIIDDDNSTIHLLTEYFKKRGVTTRNSSSASETFDILNYGVPKLILLDIILPGENGYEICKKIKSDNKLKKVPVYFITAVPENEVYEKIKETRAEGYFLKPFNMSEFNTLLNQL